MGQPVVVDTTPYASFSKMKHHDLGPISKSVEAVMKKLEALTKGSETERGSLGTATEYGGQTHVEPPGLHQSELQLKLGCSNSFTAFRGRGKTLILPDFDGSNNNSFISWLYELKCYFKNHYLSESRKFKLAVSCLKGGALLWFHTLNFSRRMEGRGMVKTWPKLEHHMRKKYSPSSVLNDSEITIETIRQKLESLNGDIKPCENYQPIYEINLEPKPETVEQTELEIACSLDEVNHVSDACIVRCLNPIENEPLIIDHEGDEESPALTLSKPLKLSNTCLAPTHCENKDQIPNLSPNESTSNHLLFECQAQKNNQSISHVTAEIHWESSKGEATGGSYFVSCPRVQNLNFCTSYCPGFRTCFLGSIICALPTPHFHFYMLVRLQVSLVHLSANSDILEGKNGVMDQVRSCCPFLKFLCFKMSNVPNICENLLRLFGISCASYPPGLEGDLGSLEMFMMRLMHQNSNSPLDALLSPNSDGVPYSRLRSRRYMLLVIQCGIIVVKLGVEPPWPFGEGYMDLVEKKTGMSIDKGNKSAHASGLYVQFSLLVAELLSAAPMSPRQAILVFDPGGRYVISVHEYNCSFDQARCKEIFFLTFRI